MLARLRGHELNISHSSSNHIIGSIPWVQPIVHSFFGQDHWHAVMDKRYAIGRRPCEDREPGFVTLDPIKTRHEEHIAARRFDCVLDLFALPFFPFEVM